MATDEVPLGSGPVSPHIDANSTIPSENNTPGVSASEFSPAFQTPEHREETASDHHADGHKNLPKIPACAECKRLKVKCVRSDPDNFVSDCLRCIKKNLTCITGLNAKRYKLEDRFHMNLADKKTQVRRFDELKKVQMCSTSMRDRLLESWKILTSKDDLRLQLLERYEYTSLAKPSNNVSKRGLLTRAQVIERVNLYRNYLYPKFSVVDCPPPEAIDEFMNETPVLFHAILDVAGQLIQDEKEKENSLILHNMVLRTVIDEIMVVSVKSIELLKCLILLTQWYNESELYHQQRLHVLSVLAVSVSYDLGLGGATIITTHSKAAAPFEQMVTPQGTSDGYTLESLRLWVAVYTTLFQNLMANRRPIKSHWNRYTEWAVDVLRTLSLEKRANGEYSTPNEDDFKSDSTGGVSPAGPSNLYVGDFDTWELAKVRHLQEIIVLTVFKQQNETVAIDLNEQSGQETMHKLGLAIDDLERSFAEPSLRRKMVIGVTKALLHQAVLYDKYNDELGRAPFTNFSLNIHSGPLNHQAVESFRQCISNAVMYLDVVAKRSMLDIVAEVSSSWCSITLCCDIILKCRTCTIFNRNFANAYFVTEDDVAYIHRIIDLMDDITKAYPNCNNAISFGFFIKLLLCHHDARQRHYAVKRTPVYVGDPAYVQYLVSSDASIPKKHRRYSEMMQNPPRKQNAPIAMRGAPLRMPPEFNRMANVSEATMRAKSTRMNPGNLNQGGNCDNLDNYYNNGSSFIDQQPNVLTNVESAYGSSINANSYSNMAQATQPIIPASYDDASRIAMMNVPLRSTDNEHSGNFVDTDLANMATLNADQYSPNMTPNQRHTPQFQNSPGINESSDLNFAWNETPPFEGNPVFDSQALNYIESFWGDFNQEIGGEGIRNHF